VIDVGTLDGTDYTIPAFQRGYRVFAFEVNEDNQRQTIDAFLRAGMAEGQDFTVVDVVPGQRSLRFVPCTTCVCAYGLTNFSIVAGQSAHALI
jgi:hypothetical protein